MRSTSSGVMVPFTRGRTEGYITCKGCRPKLVGHQTIRKKINDWTFIAALPISRVGHRPALYKC